MVIRRQPIQQEQEAKINEIIKKGGSSVEQKKSTQKAYFLNLRLPLPLKNQIDELIASDPVQPTMTMWILEAMKQRLQREKQNS